VNAGSETLEAKHVSGIKTFHSSLTAKSRVRPICEFLHCAFEGQADYKIQHDWLCSGSSKGNFKK